jgi:hypothetical protein
MLQPYSYVPLTEEQHSCLAALLTILQRPDLEGEQELSKKTKEHVLEVLAHEFGVFVTEETLDLHLDRFLDALLKSS